MLKNCILKLDIILLVIMLKKLCNQIC